MNAAQIIQLLEQKHSKDVFVPECKDGPSYGSHMRMDAWVMPRSWSNQAVTGYEVKVDRSDFLRDNKWNGYLQYCNLFYFVCPAKLIQPEELPEGVGLMYVSNTGTRIYTKRKAIHRDVDIPESLFRYILMARTQITEPSMDNIPNERRKRYWENWLEKKEVNKAFGDTLRGTIAETVNREILSVRREHALLQEQMERLEGVREFIRSIGLNPDGRYELSEYAIRRKVEELQSIIPNELVRSIGFTASQLHTLGDTMKSISEQLVELRDRKLESNNESKAAA